MTELLSLTTVLKPPKKFLVDGDEYELLGVDHLSADDEADVMALFSRYGILQSDLEVQSEVRKGAETAKKMKATRLTILTKLTTLPLEVAKKLPLTQQVLLLEAVQAEVEAEGEEDDEPASVPEPEVVEAG